MINQNRKESTTAKLRALCKDCMTKPNRIYVDRRTHVLLVQESDGEELVARVKNGVTLLSWRDVPIYPVLIDVPLMDLIQ